MMFKTVGTRNALDLNILELLCCDSVHDWGFDAEETGMPGISWHTLINPAVLRRHHCVNCEPQTAPLHCAHLLCYDGLVNTHNHVSDEHMREIDSAMCSRSQMWFMWSSEWDLELNQLLKSSIRGMKEFVWKSFLSVKTQHFLVPAFPVCQHHGGRSYQLPLIHINSGRDLMSDRNKTWLLSCLRAVCKPVSVLSQRLFNMTWMCVTLWGLKMQVPIM